MKKNSYAASPLRKKGFLFELSKNKTLFLMLIPGVLISIIFAYIPMGGSVIAFKNYNISKGILGSPWASNYGFGNFTYLFNSGKLWSLTKNTISYNVVFIIVNLLLSVSFAIIFSEIAGKYLKKFFQSTMLLPHFISWVIVGGFAYSILGYEFGILNTFLESIGKDPINVYEMPSAWRYILTGANAWKLVGYQSIVYLAAVMGISHEIYESAYLDGAGIFKRIWYITLPLLRPTITIMLLLGIGGVIKGNFEMFYNFIGSNGKLFETTDVIDTYVFRTLRGSTGGGGDMTRAAAAGFYQNFIGMFLVLGANYAVKLIDSENSLF